MNYRTIVADPPWDYSDGFRGFNGTPGSERKMVERDLPYASMTVDEVAALPVADLADPGGANLFLWTTNRYLPDAFGVVSDWGFDYRQTLVWFKTGASPLTGSVAPTACEFLLFARRGKGAGIGEKWASPLVTTKRPGPNRHSAKPEAFLDLIEQVSPGPYLELFARRARFGWDYAGDGSLGTVEIPGLRSPGEAEAA